MPRVVRWCAEVERTQLGLCVENPRYRQAHCLQSNADICIGLQMARRAVGWRMLVITTLDVQDADDGLRGGWPRLGRYGVAAVAPSERAATATHIGSCDNVGFGH